jgi:hypothetical protein
VRLIIAIVQCLSLTLATTFAIATECSCREPIPADSIGSGTCTKTQNGNQSCKLDWNAGGSRDQKIALLNGLERQGIRLSDPGGSGETVLDRSASSLFRPDNDPANTVQAMGVMLASALFRHASDRLLLYRAFLDRYSDARSFSLFSPGQTRAESDTLSAGGRNYSVSIAFGCLQFRDGPFLLVVKTQFARQRGNCDDPPQ